MIYHASIDWSEYQLKHAIWDQAIELAMMVILNLQY